MSYLKDNLKEIKADPKNSVIDLVHCAIIIGCIGLLLFMAAVLQGCSVSKGTYVKGKATIITVDTTVVIHNATLKFKRGENM